MKSFAHRIRLTLGTAASLVVLVFAFQNCGKPGNIGQMNPGPNGEVFKVSTSQFRDVVLPDESNRRTLDLNIDSGTIKSSDGNRYCLNNSDLKEIQDLLNTASVCEPAKRDDLICTMIYKLPYAQLRSSSMELALGEARSGCDQGLDLCGDAGIKLRAFVADVISGIDGMQCN